MRPTIARPESASSWWRRLALVHHWLLVRQDCLPRRGSAVDIVVQITIGLVAIGIGGFIGKAWERAKLLRRWSYIRKFLGRHRKVQIIVSSVEISGFKFARGSEATLTKLQVPRNILYMPMPEGRAIGMLVNLLNRIDPKLKVQLVTAKNYDPEVLTIAIGGPSVNAFTHDILLTEFPEFHIDYPATRRARYEGHSFETLRTTDNILTRDYGFIFVTRTTKGAPCLVFCGIRAFGSAMAVEMFRSMPHGCEAAQLIQKCRKAFIVAEGKVDGMEWSAVRLEFCRELDPSSRRVRSMD